jgi:hypothetical protein
MVPAFGWEANAFENTVLAFNSQAVHTDILQEATPAEMSWGVYEAELLFHQSQIDETPEFDYEPMVYAATVLNRAGFVLAPDLLGFAQEELDKFNKRGDGVSKKDVQTQWKSIKDDVTKHKFSEDSPMDVQLSRLASVQLYLEEHVTQYERDLSKLRRR